MTLPTRITEGSDTLIDQIFTNNDKKDFHLSGIILSNISDHFPYFYCINTLNEYKKHIKFIYNKNNNKQNIDNIYSELVKTDIMHLLDPDPNRDPNFNYNMLEQIITSAVNKHMPMKKVKFNKHEHKKSNWITYGIIKSIKFRDNLFNRLKQMQQNSSTYINTKQNLVTYNKIPKRLIHEAKLNYYSKFEKCKTDSKQTWKSINDILKRKEVVNLPDYMNINNCKTSNNTLISNQFNNYFSSIRKDMAAAINNIPRDFFKKYLTMNISTKFTFKHVNETQIENIIKNLQSKQSYGYDGISSVLLKKLQTLLIKPIALITNQ